MDLENDRGIFILSIFRKMVDKMTYNDKYDDIDHHMSDSNIGARRGKNIRNHLFVIYAIINSVIQGESGCIDIQIYDLIKAFDALWLDDCLNDVFDAVTEEGRDDKLALLYDINKENHVAVNTAVGQTERFGVEKIVTQGGTWGSLLCSNHIDSLGRRCSATGEYMYTYKDQVEVLPLAMVDDLLGIANCGHNSLALNTFINSQIELKKLKFHIPDETGKSKCNVMHVGPSSVICPQLQVHGTVMQKISHDKYLGDIVSADGKNDLNISSRASKGLGIVNQVMNMLDRVTFGSHYFTTAMLFRESIFLNGILTNAESWHGLTDPNIGQLESVDRLLLRQVLNTPVSTPTEALYLELGMLSIGTIIKTRRVNFLHSLLKCEENEMVLKVFSAQWSRPAKKDLEDFKIIESFEKIKAKSSDTFKSFVKKRAVAYEFDRLMKLKNRENRSKMSDLSYSKLELQEYLKLNTMSKEAAQTVFRYRVRMANYGGNFRGGNGPVNCPICGSHLDGQKIRFEN